MARIDEMGARLDRFLADCAAPDWDSYGAKPVAPETVAAARRWLPIMADIPGCSVAPTPSGGVCFQWEEDGVSVEWECWKAGQPPPAQTVAAHHARRTEGPPLPNPDEID